MRPRRICVELSRLGVVAGLAALVTLARAQAPGAPSPEPTPPAGDATGVLIAGAAMIALFAITIIGVVVKILDLKRKRNDERLALQARVTEALLADRALGPLPVTATAHASLWRRSPVTIEVRGQVPTPALREAAINLVLQEMGDIAGTRFRIVDRMTVVSAVPRAA